MSKIEAIRSRSHPLDPCTNSNYSHFKVVHTDLTIGVSFTEKKLNGKVIYQLKNLTGTSELVLDTSYLDIASVTVNGSKVAFDLKPVIPVFGSPLSIPLDTKDDVEVAIEFSTTDKCTAIQFIQGDTGPYVFSQCQAIHARSMFPCFDTPGVKSPYKFTAKSPSVCTMSGRPQPSSEKDTYYFDQPIPIPSYLVSITSGNLHKAPIGPRSDVYSELPNLEACQWEFEKDMENFIQIAEKLVFEYEWSRFDSLVLPSSFPYGGMEIPNMTQLTPTLISKDRTQVKVMAHELAHSWSGNLVTNCSWEHFWLNEGWTVYLERRIVGAIAAAGAKEEGLANPEEHGEQVRHFNAIIGWNALVESVNSLEPRFTSLVWDLENADPDDAFSRIPYEKGFNFLFHIETRLGGVEVFDPFIKYYFKKFRYQSLDSAQFIEALYDFYTPLGKADILDKIDLDTWLFQPGLPEYPNFDTTLADQVYSYVDKWVDFVKSGEQDIKFSEADVDSFEGEQEMLFIETLTEKLKDINVSSDLIRKLPSVYPKYGASNNGEYLSRWNELLIKYGNYQSNDEVVTSFANWLGSVGRMKFVRPGYKLLKTGVSTDFAIATFKRFEDKYHPICRTMVKKDLGLV
ncbi:leukotriene A-4 hydrolase 1 [Scheffersomyces xylosifermentans]|uniref:leukotriene A-4 hydrolase 1 n=1 Tax=Scheffersomyces xylosifermentans TaxID=1304137 RepID=UPI00315D0D6F